MTPLLHLDSALFHWINSGWSNPILDMFMSWITHLGNPTAVISCVVLAGFILFRQLSNSGNLEKGGQRNAILKSVVFCLYLALISGVNYGAFHSIKYIVNRPRPFVQEKVIVRVSPATASHLRNDGSFPSGHAANAFMLAVFFAELFRRERYVFYFLAALVAFSRIYLGVHYPGDVLAGGMIGFFNAQVMLLFYPGQNSVL
jgi:undecaprenyl-diphosphatase